MNHNIGSRWITTAAMGLILAAVAFLDTTTLTAQNLGGLSPEQNDRGRAEDSAALVIDGVVREVFRSERRGQTDYLVEIEVSRAELGRRPARVLVPVPGDRIYVHDSRASGDGLTSLPEERSRVRAYLSPRSQGGWTRAGADWIVKTEDALASMAPDDPPPPAQVDVASRPVPTPSPGSVPSTTPTPKPTRVDESRSDLATLGLTVEERTIGGRVALRVSSVERGSPGSKAGLEPGDVIAGLDGKPLESLEQLEAEARRGGTLELAVIDVNSGRTARVQVELGSATASPPAPTETPRTPIHPPSEPARPSINLGMRAEPVTVGARTAMKVVRVEPGGIAARAGLEPGDVIVAANGAPITGAEQLAAAIRKSGPVLNLTVRDTRTGRDVPVEVALGGEDVPPRIDRPSEPSDPASQRPGRTIATRGLGVVTELVFLDTEAAVKVTEVERGGPGERAGLEVGDVIVAVNDTPVLHPNDLTEAIRQAGATATLTVINPRDGRKVPVRVDLGGNR